VADDQIVSMRFQEWGKLIEQLSTMRAMITAPDPLTDIQQTEVHALMESAWATALRLPVGPLAIDSITVTQG
jgi:hypothetical protein